MPGVTLDIGAAAPGLDAATRLGFPVGDPPLAAVRGLHERPWSPCRLRVESGDDGWHIAWTGRVRAGGDSWEREAVAVDAARWRVRVLDGDAMVRTFEVEGETALYAAADVAADWPGGVGADAVVAVAQWGAGFGWGVESTARLNAV
ncbi:MAG TPA: hypothetical protein VGE54_09670 [Brevundimonas sp.]